MHTINNNVNDQVVSFVISNENKKDLIGIYLIPTEDGENNC